jgi:NAD(P)-dependent dehydrogenase (short-subunit alcohol dehydrogenase family)
MQLAGKVALITGAGSGIGRASALLLAQEGAKIAALGRTESQLKEAVTEIQRNDGEAIPLLADVSQPDQMQRAIQQLVDEWGRIDIVFANAGINGVWASLEELEPEEWDETLNINLKGTFLTVKYAVPYLKKQGGSIIVNSSVNGTRMFSNVGVTAYACSKAGQVPYTRQRHLPRVDCDRSWGQHGISQPGSHSCTGCVSRRLGTIDRRQARNVRTGGAVGAVSGIGRFEPHYRHGNLD